MGSISFKIARSSGSENWTWRMAMALTYAFWRSVAPQYWSACTFRISLVVISGPSQARESYHPDRRHSARFVESSAVCDCVNDGFRLLLGGENSFLHWNRLSVNDSRSYQGRHRTRYRQDNDLSIFLYFYSHYFKKFVRVIIFHTL